MCGAPGCLLVKRPPADVALYLGLVTYLAELPQAPEQQLPFSSAKQNFYDAARYGLAANVTWLDGSQHNIAELLLTGLLDQAMHSLLSLGVREDEVQAWHEILRGRLESRQNGAAWQRRKHQETEGDLTRLLLEYGQQQDSGRPVHLWQ